MAHRESGRRKIVLALLPFWTPYIPPMGIVSLKTFLRKHGYQVKTLDATVEEVFKDLYQEYFGRLRQFIPEERRGNFLNVGHDVLQNHMMAYLHRRGDREHRELVRQVVYFTFYSRLDDPQIDSIDETVKRIFDSLGEYFRRVLEEEKPEVVGLTAYHHNLPASLFVFRLCKEYNPDILTAMGGGIFSETLPLGSEDLEIFLRKTEGYLDKVVIGEGQNLFLRILQGRFPDSKRLFTLKDIDGQTLDISTLSVPDLSDMDIPRYSYLAASGSKSCPFDCSFCSVSVYYGKYQKKNARQTVEEMRLLYDRFGQQLFFLLDSLLNPVISDITGEIIARDLPFYLDCYLRVDDAMGDIENTMSWRRGGLYRTRIGIESGSQRVLDLMGKKIRVEQTRAALTSLAYAGVKTTAYVLIGHPGETEADFQQTLELMDELKENIYEAECNPFAYFYSGQTHADKWAGKRRLLFPPEATDLLISQTWTLDCQPRREEVYRRMNVFVRHCKRLGIPNPYTMNEIIEADERWRRLHRHAAPSMEQLMSARNDGGCFLEDRHFKHVRMARDMVREDDSFAF